ncbi:hypothetical protein [Ancylobacter sp. IITR112]|uniref:hypothetical protein n=1 Tax=Ancylobacter sp. IITR112 TaxID=3138073 RepID=UPI00352B9DCA
MRRTDLQGYAQAKIDDACLLLQHQRWSNAYYLAGYGVELALKACIAKQIAAETIPDKSILRDVLSHQYMNLIGLAGLRDELKRKQDSNSHFAANWGIANEWSPDSRYRSCSAIESQLLIESITDIDNGIMQWIKQFW